MKPSHVCEQSFAAGLLLLLLLLLVLVLLLLGKHVSFIRSFENGVASRCVA